MNDFELADLAGNDVNAFIKAYRDTMRREYDSSIARLNQEKRTQDASIMSNANRAGMMFSNFPQRQKMQYEAQTYLPSLAKANETYQTGLQALRNNAVKAYNNIASMREAIADLNEPDTL